MGAKLTRSVLGAGGRRGLAVGIGLAAVAVAGAFHTLDTARRAAEADAAWVRQRLVEKRALVRALQSDLALVAQTTERVSQMASIAHEQNATIRRVAQIDEAPEGGYTPARLAAIDEFTMHRSEDGARAIAQLAFLEEEFAATADSLSLVMALSKGWRSQDVAAPRSRTQPIAAPAILRTAAPVATPAVVRTPPPGEVTPGMWPVAGEISSRFGWRESPYGRGTKRHTGLDIMAEYGTPVRVSAPGVIVFAGRDSGGYGTTVVVDHGGDVQTLYGHLSGLYVSEGDRVRGGTAIGAVGSSGRATGVHLHYEVRVGNVPVDPLRYLKNQAPQQVAFVPGYAATR